MLKPECLEFHSLSDFSSSKRFNSSKQVLGAEPDLSEKQVQVLNNLRTDTHRSKKVQTRAISVPAGEAASGPPADSWAWRKYGQKPIKGSPYPRSYYRCSSYKGCSARKQVERNRTDPSMLIITYTFEHNHPLAVNNKKLPETNSSHKKAHCTNISRPYPQTDMNPVLSSAITESPAVSLQGEAAGAERPDSCISRSETEEDDEDLFADLGELPESSAIFFSRGFFDDS